MTKLIRIEEEIIASVLLEEVMKSEVAADMVASRIRQRLEVNGYGKFPQPLDDKELEKALLTTEEQNEVLTGSVRRNLDQPAWMINHLGASALCQAQQDKDCALLQPKIEEAIRDANPRGWQALKGREEAKGQDRYIEELRG